MIYRVTVYGLCKDGTGDEYYYDETFDFESKHDALQAVEKFALTGIIVATHKDTDHDVLDWYPGNSIYRMRVEQVLEAPTETSYYDLITPENKHLEQIL